MTRVFNLLTQKEMFYSCPPIQAVRAAHEQERGNYNTWMYKSPHIENGKFCYFLGDWGVLKTKQRADVRGKENNES